MRTFLLSTTFAVLMALAAPQASAQNDLPRFEVGPVFSVLHLPNSSQQNSIGVGGRLSYNWTPYFAIEGEVTGSPFDTGNGFSSLTGGRVTQAYFGAKLGLRWQRFGLYGRFRPGLIHFGKVLTAIDFQNGSFTFQTGGATHPSFDVGGTLEIYLTRRLLLRYDAGDTVIHFGEHTIAVTGTTILNSTIPSTTTNNFQFSVGASFRF